MILARREGVRGGRGIAFLFGPQFRIGTEETFEEALSLLWRDGVMRALRAAAVIFPFGDPVPHIKSGDEGWNVELGPRPGQCAEHGGGPWPVGTLEEMRSLRRLARVRVVR